MNALLPLSLGSPKVLDSPKERFDMTAVAPTVAQAQNQKDLSRLAHIPYPILVSKVNSLSEKSDEDDDGDDDGGWRRCR